MKVSIIGNSAIGLAYYAMLASAECDVAMWSPSGSLQSQFGEAGHLESEGKISGSFPMHAFSTANQTADESAVLVIATPANAFLPVIQALVPHVRHNHCIIFSSHSSLAAVHLAKLLAIRGIYPLICGWSTTLATACKTSPTSVHVSTIRSVVDIAAIPTKRSDEALNVCRGIFGERFAIRQNLLALTLSNLNPPVHAANMLGNLTRAERGESWGNHDITPAVGALIQALDDERLGLAESLGLGARSIQDHYVASFKTGPGKVHEMAEVVYKARPDAKGPTTLNTRFIDEDVPFGLYPLEMVGKMAGVPMPLHTAAIDIFSALRERDYRGENPLLPLLRDELSQREKLFNALEGGYLTS